MRMWWFITTLVITAAFICNSPAYAYDNNPLQDICVAVSDSEASVFVNGNICKDPKLATPNDFYFPSLNISKVVYPNYGIGATFVGVQDMPGLNTLGMSICRIEFEPQGHAPLHTHPRATELITVLEGTLYVAFLVPDPADFFTSRLFSKILYPGDVFVFPRGLIHFQYNVGDTKTVVFGNFNSQNSGIVTFPSSIITSQPLIVDDIIALGVQLNKTEIAELRKKFS
ncbi:germin-like protein subfamily 1 member 13 [Solanum stenotomum]|uniref:germin-like protein subfamily 1 member 13 n=1 Tax=Solanum stenotomum TaxID=172797 RepID=UPI0020D0DE35|nr:germin-like protein subfamily 1 member 13 [Solanum stenotomum]